MTGYLPPELLDRVFSHLHFPFGWDRGHDRRDLCACRLVNRLWADVAAVHVFSAISLRVDVSDATRSSDSNPAQSLAGFRDFLAMTPGLCSAVQTLSIVNVARAAEARKHIEPALLHTIFALLPRIQRIHLSGIFQCFSVVPRARYDLRFSAQVVEVSGGITPSSCSGSLQSLLHLTDMFREIGELVFNQSSLNHTYCAISSLPTPSVLHIRYNRAITNPSWLVHLTRHLDISTLHSLSIGLRRVLHNPQGWENLYGFLQTIGSQLTHLGLYVGGLVEAENSQYHCVVEFACRVADRRLLGDDSVYGVLFDVCAQLRSVSFTFGRSNGDYYYKLGWERLVEAIQHLPRSVRLIGIELDSFADDVRRLRTARDDIARFEGLITKRQPHTVVAVRSSDQPILQLDEQRQIRELFLELSQKALLQF